MLLISSPVKKWIYLTPLSVLVACPAAWRRGEKRGWKVRNREELEENISVWLDFLTVVVGFQIPAEINNWNLIFWADQSARQPCWSGRVEQSRYPLVQGADFFFFSLLESQSSTLRSCKFLSSKPSLRRFSSETIHLRIYYYCLVWIRIIKISFILMWHQLWISEGIADYAVDSLIHWLVLTFHLSF